MADCEWCPGELQSAWMQQKYQAEITEIGSGRQRKVSKMLRFTTLFPKTHFNEIPDIIIVIVIIIIIITPKGCNPPCA